jgi:SAM-dependent methyltransferase
MTGLFERARRRLASRLRRAKKHPFDVAYQVETSRLVPPGRIKSGGAEAMATNVGYVGSQPSIIRGCLALIPDLAAASFVDLGCGKGRACIVASEFPFRCVVGVELDAGIARRGSANARRIADRFPGRARIAIKLGDASRPELPDDGPCVIFLYHPFGEASVARLVAHLEAKIAAGQKIFVIYYNPVHCALLDASPKLARFYAARLDFAPDEAACAWSDNTHDSVVVYQGAGEPAYPALDGAQRTVTVTVPGLGADVCE